LAPLTTLFSSIQPHPPQSTLFPYTTLFRSTKTRTRPLSPLPPLERRNVIQCVPVVHGLGLVGFALVFGGQLVAQLTGRPSVSHPDRKSTRLNSSHEWISYAVFCLKKKKYKY